jgi:exodeoxyribonuclease VII small subunit
VSNAATPEPSFEDAIAELEQVVRTLEDGTTSLDAALAAYERGVGLLKSCYQHLRQAEQRILKLTGSDGDGRPKLELFEHTAAVEAERPENRRRKKPQQPGLGYES